MNRVVYDFFHSFFPVFSAESDRCLTTEPLPFALNITDVPARLITELYTMDACKELG